MKGGPLDPMPASQPQPPSDGGPPSRGRDPSYITRALAGVAASTSGRFSVPVPDCSWAAVGALNPSEQAVCQNPQRRFCAHGSLLKIHENQNAPAILM